MKVRCMRSNEPDREPAGVRIGDVYEVLCVFVGSRGDVKFRLIGADRYTPALYDAWMFDVSDGTIPPNWIVRVRDSGGLDLEPARWLVDGFWEDYFNGVPEAERIFDEEAAVIRGGGLSESRE